MPSEDYESCGLRLKGPGEAEVLRRRVLAAMEQHQVGPCRCDGVECLADAVVEALWPEDEDDYVVGPGHPMNVDDWRASTKTIRAWVNGDGVSTENLVSELVFWAMEFGA